MSTNDIKLYKRLRGYLIQINDEIDKNLEHLKEYRQVLENLPYNENKYHLNTNDKYNRIKNLLLQIMHIEEDFLKDNNAMKEALIRAIDKIKVFDQYDITNGLIGMKRDVNNKLSYYFRDSEHKTRQFYGISSQYFLWKNNYYFINLHSNPNVILYGDVIRENRYIFKSLSLNNDNGVIINHSMPFNSGIYLLKIKIINPNIKMEIFFNKSDNPTEFIYNESVEVDELLISDPDRYYEFYPVRWGANDYLNFVINTNECVITYLIKHNDEENNTKYSVDLHYYHDDPLKVYIRLTNNYSLCLLYFGELK
jgi:hypothetical protein